MGYSLRTRSASTTSVTAEPAAKKAAPATAKKAAPAKKSSAPKKPAAPKKTTVAKKAEKPVAAKKTATSAKKATPKAKEEVKAEEPEVKTTKVAAKAKATKASAKPAATKTTKTSAKAAVKKTTAAKPAKASPAKSTKTVEAKPVRKAPARKTAASPKKKTISAPVVTIEEVDTPSLPEVEPICHEESEKTEAEKIVEIIEGEVVNTHIRFSDDEEEVKSVKIEEKSVTEPLKDNVDAKTSPSLKEVSIHSSDFEALDELKDEPPAFELYQSESDDEEIKQEEDIKVDEFDEEVKVEEKEESAMQPVSNGHAAFEVFTSQEGAKTFNWSHTGSTYYQEDKNESMKSESEVDEPVTKISEPVIEAVKPVIAEVSKTATVAEPTVISNPFGFGFTATTPSSTSYNNSNYPINHFQSVSSPLDKLCNLTSSQVNSNNNPLKISSTFGTSGSDMMSSSNMPSSYLPTSPAMPSTMMVKASKSPSIQGDKEAPQRSPSAIQSIIVDDKHEDFSAF